MISIKSIGERDRTTQYDSWVKPIPAEEKIVITQRAHKKAQIAVYKAIKHIEHALVEYTQAPFGSDKVVEMLAKEISHLRGMQEAIKKETFNALPYKDLEQERIDEKSFSGSRRKLSLRSKLFIAGVITNVSIYVGGYLLNNFNIIGIGGLFSLIFGGAAYFAWINNDPKTIKSHKKVGPKVW